jgi:hypothetical protein
MKRLLTVMFLVLSFLVWTNNVFAQPLFAPAINYGAGGGPYSVFVADLDGDGDSDLAVANSASDNLSILLNLTLQAPQFIDPAESPIDLCTYQCICDTIEVIDGNDDNITMSLEGPGYLQVIFDEAGQWSGAYCIDGGELCGTSDVNTIRVIASDGNLRDTLIYNLQFVGKVTASMEPFTYIEPGDQGVVPILFNSYAPCFCLGGLALTVMYNGDALTVNSLVPGPMLSEGDYFNVVYDTDDPYRSTAKIIFFNYTIPLCDIEPDVTLASLHFSLDSEYQYPVADYLPISLVSGGPQAASISDTTGFFVWYSDGCDDTSDSTSWLQLLPQPAWITGTVTDRFSDPIEDVLVSILGDTVTSDTTGPDGIYSLVVDYLDYYDLLFYNTDYRETIAGDILVSLGETTYVDITLYNSFPYLPGDANMDGKNTGNDVTYLVNYFRSAPTTVPCYFINGTSLLWASADANGSCDITGNDVTKMVNFNRSDPTAPVLLYCPDYEPLYHTVGEVPDPLPDGWPFCDNPVVTGTKIISTSPTE